MNQRSWLFIAIGTMLALSLTPLSAQTPARPAAEAKSDNVKPTTASADFGGNLSALFGSGLQHMEAEDISFDPEGDCILKGRAFVKTEQIEIRCNTITVSQATKILLALGTPVRIQQGGMRAVCRRLTYDMRKKQYNLEQNPEVWQQEGDKVTHIAADQIILTQGEKGMGVQMKMDPKNPKKMPTFEVLPASNAKTTEPLKKEEPKRISGEKGLMQIKVPGIE